MPWGRELPFPAPLWVAARLLEVNWLASEPDLPAGAAAGRAASLSHCRDHSDAPPSRPPPTPPPLRALPLLCLLCLWERSTFCALDVSSVCTGTQNREPNSDSPGPGWRAAKDHLLLPEGPRGPGLMLRRGWGAGWCFSSSSG